MQSLCTVYSAPFRLSVFMSFVCLALVLCAFHGTISQWIAHYFWMRTSGENHSFMAEYKTSCTDQRTKVRTKQSRLAYLFKLLLCLWASVFWQRLRIGTDRCVCFACLLQYVTQQLMATANWNKYQNRNWLYTWVHRSCRVGQKCQWLR